MESGEGKSLNLSINGPKFQVHPRLHILRKKISKRHVKDYGQGSRHLFCNDNGVNVKKTDDLECLYTY